MVDYLCKLERVKKAIDKGVDFLYSHQLDYGEFKTYASWNRWFLGSWFDSTHFSTALILYSINEIKDEKVEKIRKKAIDFLLEGKEAGGIWRFWTKRNKKRLPADLDDISVISYILKLNNVPFEDNLPLILKNRNEENLFLTWLVQEKDKKEVSWWLDKIHKIFELAKHDIDDVVNVNVLIYLGKEDVKVCSFINQLIESEKRRSLYYPHSFVLFYAVSKAFKEGIKCFQKNKQKIVKSILEKKNDFLRKDLETALALNTLFNFDYQGKEIEMGIDYLLKRQLKSGAWRRGVLFLGPFPYRYYGSEELTTAFCLEALQKYLNLKDEIKKQN